MTTKSKRENPKYSLNKSGEFVISEFDNAKPFASFLPGIAGKYGIPMWAFYVNRGQAIASFGTRDKDHAIMEYFPANKSWEFTQTLGFRTFIKVFKGKNFSFYEPFRQDLNSLNYKRTNRMEITSYDLKITETNLTLGLEIEVKYFTIPNEPFAALARQVTIKNLSSAPKKIQLLDGMPQIVPFGTNNWCLKKMGRTIEAWMAVENLENHAPFYRLTVDPADRPQVIHIKEGNFYLGFTEEEDKNTLIKPIVDPEAIFENISDFSYPKLFIEKTNFPYPAGQFGKNKMPAGFLLLDLTLNKGQTKTLSALAGYMDNMPGLNASLKKITTPGYLKQKEEENRKLVEDLQQEIHTESAKPEFNLYAKQTYLDNILRGGYPVIFENSTTNKLFYLYSRKHGDLERDYNRFQLQSAYFSQGNGNYRDVNQNRRSNTWFNPKVGDENIITFLNLLQTDGYNPLIVKGVHFILDNIDGFKNELLKNIDGQIAEIILKELKKPFTPGEIIIFLEQNKLRLKISHDEFLKILISFSHMQQDAEHGEGFWIDHWTYNLDLIENYLGLFPEKLKELIFEKKVFTYYDNTHIVKPRSQRYVLWEGLPKQLHSVTTDEEKKELISQRNHLPHLIRTQYGKGEIYYTTLAEKLLCLLANKITSLDPSGCGIEMEADKPNWFDSLNGLPALSGSSLCETIELKRLILFFINSIEKTGVESILVAEELHDFLKEVAKLLKDWQAQNINERDFIYWDQSNTAKEEFRLKTKLGFSGITREIKLECLKELWQAAIFKVENAISKSQNNGIFTAYFMHEIKDYEKISASHIKPLKFIQKKLPLFLESQMHAMRIYDQKTAKNIYEKTKKSLLFDKKLKMYKVTAPLASMPEEIGRCRVFTPGWLENESIWLHMEYKYLLEILKQGLYEEFYADIKNTFIPFQPASRYGRSILENSSFIVSSAFPNAKLHGTGFVSRLSGSTVELISIWLAMNVGKNPFYLDNEGKLNLKFAPALAGWLFVPKTNTYSFNFLSNIRVTYHNPGRKNTFGKNGAKIQKISFSDANGSPVEINGDSIPSPYALQIREQLIKKIDIYLR